MLADTTPPANLTPAEVAEWEAACAATPGPYRTVSHYQQPFCWETIGVGECVPDCTNEHHRDPCKSDILCENANQHSNARNIATNANPTTVRARLREISELRAEVDLHELRMAEVSHVLHWREQQLDIVAELVTWLGVDCYKTSNLEEFRNAITAALRTEAGTARLDTEGENDGVDQGE